MELTLATPALLFPAGSLLLLVYANRFLNVAKLVRELHAVYRANPEPHLLQQIGILRTRLVLIRNMHAFGIASLFLCGLCMFLLFAGQGAVAKWMFGASLLCFLASLAVSFRETQLSISALTLHLSDLDDTSDAPRLP